MDIEKKFPRAPTDVIYIALSMLQKWSTLLKEVDRERVIQLKYEILRWMKNFHSSMVVPSDVVEI
jgi:hypothetical protein